jgi:hypothetical protein
MITGNTHSERAESQVDEWVKGNSIHNKEDDECCPDFSCCKPELKAPIEIRETFKNANQEQRESMLFSFLGNAIPMMTNKKVIIVNGKDEINSQLN